MLPQLPAYITVVFILTVLLTIWFLWKASSSPIVIMVVLIWLIIQGILSFTGFYRHVSGIPPRLALAIVPPLLLIIFILATKSGTRFTRTLRLKRLHLLHVVRIPVEICLYWLSLQKAVPELITFAGNNFDIITGITAIILYYTCFKGREIRSRNLLLAWNIIGIVMLANVVINGILSAPTALQQLSFEQPNIAILYFPFIWLPSFIVMAVLFCHLVTIKRLLAS